MVHCDPRCPSLQSQPEWFTLLVPVYQVCAGKEAINWMFLLQRLVICNFVKSFVTAPIGNCRHSSVFCLELYLWFLPHCMIHIQLAVHCCGDLSACRWFCFTGDRYFSHKVANCTSRQFPVVNSNFCCCGLLCPKITSLFILSSVSSFCAES